MLKMIFGLLNYKKNNRDLYDKDLTRYPEGYRILEESVSFMGKLKEQTWSTFLLFITYF